MSDVLAKLRPRLLLPTFWYDVAGATWNDAYLDAALNAWLATKSPTFRFIAGHWTSAQFEADLNAWLTSVLPPTAVAGPTQFYCSDTNQWHTVKLVGNPFSTWDIGSGGGSQFPLTTSSHAFVSYQYPCADTGRWHKVMLTGTPNPTWDIDPVGVAVPDPNLDLAFSTQRVWNNDIPAWVTVKLVGAIPTWDFS